MSSSCAFAGHEIVPHKEAHQHEKNFPQQLFSPTGSCKVIPINTKDIQALQEKSAQKVEKFQKNKEFQDFQQETFQKKEPVLEDKEFQQFVNELNEKALTSFPTCQSTEKIPAVNSQVRNPEGNLYIFVSFSLGEKALMNLAHEAKQYGATLVLRGFRACPRPCVGEEHGEPRKISYGKTIQALQKIILKTGQGVSIDPELFTFFSVSSVPTYILAKPFQLNSSERTQAPLHDRIQGHTSVHYVLETFAKEGDLQNEAKALLTKDLLSNRLQGKGRDK
ncbi:MAG: hypothetical protein KBD36_00170 [Alphaproteobacteria bacterium]|nr:hypothetical protein [Alphaproteobacteria bacterium]MBP9776251.1 hypothetical protein [Alphaproteobacteria bacterium]